MTGGGEEGDCLSPLSAPSSSSPPLHACLSHRGHSGSGGEEKQERSEPVAMKGTDRSKEQKTRKGSGRSGTGKEVTPELLSHRVPFQGWFSEIRDSVG